MGWNHQPVQWWDDVWCVSRKLVEKYHMFPKNWRFDFLKVLTSKIGDYLEFICWWHWIDNNALFQCMAYGKSTVPYLDGYVSCMWLLWAIMFLESFTSNSYQLTRCPANDRIYAVNISETNVNGQTRAWCHNLILGWIQFIRMWTAQWCCEKVECTSLTLLNQGILSHKDVWDDIGILWNFNLFSQDCRDYLMSVPVVLHQSL